jgi:hypothetical protein
MLCTNLIYSEVGVMKDWKAQKWNETASLEYKKFMEKEITYF